MGTRQGNKLTSNVEADHSVSLDSLSFVSLVSIPYQKPKSPPPNQENNTDPEFEFSSTRSNSNSAANPVKFTPADLLISNGQLQPRALAFHQSNRSLISNPPNFRGSIQATHGSSKRSCVQADNNTRKYHEVHNASKQSKKESTGTTTLFGKKFFKSLISPCQECHANKPGIIEAQTALGGKC